MITCFVGGKWVEFDSLQKVVDHAGKNPGIEMVLAENPGIRIQSSKHRISVYEGHTSKLIVDYHFLCPEEVAPLIRSHPRGDRVVYWFEGECIDDTTVEGFLREYWT